MKAFCSAHNISASGLKYWIRSLGYTSKRKRGKEAFIPLTISEPTAPPADLPGLFAELIFDTGTRLVFHQAVTSSFLRELLY